MSDSQKPPRAFFVLLTVLAAIFLAALVLGGRRRPAALKDWQQSIGAKAPSLARFDPDDLESAARKDDLLLIPRQILIVTNRIREREAGMFSSGVRTLSLTLNGADKFALNYQPSPQDSRAMPVKVDPFAPGTNVSLTIQEHGGVLTLIRKSAQADAKIRIE